MSTASTASLDATGPSFTVQTTLYDLIAAINDETDPDDEHAAVATVVHMLDTGQITFAEELEIIMLAWRYAEM